MAVCCAGAATIRDSWATAKLSHALHQHACLQISISCKYPQVFHTVVALLAVVMRIVGARAPTDSLAMPPQPLAMHRCVWRAPTRSAMWLQDERTAAVSPLAATSFAGVAMPLVNLVTAQPPIVRRR